MLLPETPALLALRQAVRAWTLAFEPRRRVVVALSGGADSLALTAAAVAETDSVDALIVDHRLQDGSDAVARSAEDLTVLAQETGCRPLVTSMIARRRMPNPTCPSKKNPSS